MTASATEERQAGMAEICKFFGMKLPQFRAEWSKLSDQDKADLKKGIGNGSLTY